MGTAFGSCYAICGCRDGLASQPGNRLILPSPGCRELVVRPVVTSGSRTVRIPCSKRRNIVAQGTVKWFNSEKGFGLIASDGGAPDVFVRYSASASHGYR